MEVAASNMTVPIEDGIFRTAYWETAVPVPFAVEIQIPSALRTNAKM